MQLGGIGFVHYNMSVEEQVAAVKQAKSRLPWAAAEFATAPADAPVSSLWPLQVGLHIEQGVSALLLELSAASVGLQGSLLQLHPA